MGRHLYIAGPVDIPRPVKVGISRTPKRRLRTFQTANWHELAMHRVWKDTQARAIEQATHKILKHCHIRGEWFDCTIDDAEKAIREAHWTVYNGKPLPIPWWHRVLEWMKRP